MLSENDKGIHLVVKLIGLTNDKKIKWRPEPIQTQPLPYERRYLNYVYIVQIGNDIFRLSEFEYRISGDDRRYWKHRFALDIVDSEGRVLWPCPPNPAIEDLFRIVKGETTDVDGVMARLDSFAQAS